jgi:hypothetical protein
MRADLIEILIGLPGGLVLGFSSSSWRSAGLECGDRDVDPVGDADEKIARAIARRSRVLR